MGSSEDKTTGFLGGVTSRVDSLGPVEPSYRAPSTPTWIFTVDPLAMNRLQLVRSATPLIRSDICIFCAGRALIRQSSRRRYAARPSPSVRRAEAIEGKKQSLPASAQQARNKASLPPSELLTSAKLSGALAIDVERALSFLTDFAALGPNPVHGRVQQLCEALDVDRASVTMLAQITNRSPYPTQRVLARRLLHSASNLGDPGATIQLVSQALRNARLQHPDLTLPLRHLSWLAKTGESRPARVLQGQILESRGDESGALRLYQDGADEEEDKAGDNGRADACLALGLLHRRRGNAPAATAAFQKGAALDDPVAYFHLAAAFPLGSPEYHLYTIKAAASGVPAAAHRLAVLYHHGDAALVDEPSRGAMAKEWYTLAAGDDWTPSKVGLALLLREEGKTDEGLAWLERAEGDEKVEKEISRLKGQWSDRTAVLESALVGSA